MVTCMLIIILTCVTVSTESAPRSAKFCSCFVCARSSTVCSSSWTRLQSTCSGLPSHTSLGGKAVITKTWCWPPKKSVPIVVHAEHWEFINSTDMKTVPGNYKRFITGMWLMMLNFFPHLIDHGEYWLKLSQFCLKPHSMIVMGTRQRAAFTHLHFEKMLIALLGLNSQRHQGVSVLIEKWTALTKTDTLGMLMFFF